MPKDVVIEDFRALYGDRHDETALQLSLMGSLVQIGGLLGFWLVQADDDAERAARNGELDWWVTTARGALDIWSPL